MWRWLRYTAFLASTWGLVSCGPQAVPENRPADGTKVIRLEIVCQPPVLSPARIRPIIRKHISDTYSSRGVDAAIVELYQSGLVEDIRVEPAPAPGGVIVKAVVVPRPLPGPCSVRFSGNNAFSDSRLSRESRLQADRLDNRTVETGRRAIEAYYRRFRFRDVKVAVEFSESKEGKNWTFVIEEGPRTVRLNRHSGQP